MGLSSAILMIPTLGWWNVGSPFDECWPYWDISRPLLTPSFVAQGVRIKKPLVQGQCQTVFDPNINTTSFVFPHSQLTNPPLHSFADKTWALPNTFVQAMLGNTSDIGNVNNPGPRVLFSWYDAASNFTNSGAPSLGAVIIYGTTNQSTAVTTCSVDGRWAPVSISFDPKNDVTIHQNIGSPADLLHSFSNSTFRNLTRMRTSLDLANSLDSPHQQISNDTGSDTRASAVEQLVEYLRGYINGTNQVIYPEANSSSQSSLAWRISTILNLYLTESLARAQSDSTKGSLVFHDALKPEDNHALVLNDLNAGNFSGPGGQQPGSGPWKSSKSPDQTFKEWATDNG